MPLLFLSQEGKYQYDPWGVWNDTPVSEAARVRTFSTGKYYEEPFGLYIVKHCNEVIAGDRDFPAIAVPGMFTKIERYEPIKDGFIFYLVGNGYKPISGNTIFQEKTRIQVKMHFINEDECYFTYDSLKDGNGFELAFYPEEKIIFKRLRAK